jgi:prolyl-tRNA synthetase
MNVTSLLLNIYFLNEENKILRGVFMGEELGITVPKKEFAKWYLEVIKKAEVVDQRYPVKGFPVYMPLGTKLIKSVTNLLEDELQKTGHEPVAFPVLIPEKNLQKEKEHVKGFQKEVFWITHAGDNELEERLFLRPTSETAIYPLYSLWVRSHHDLPLKLYQACQVYRYDTKMTKPLIRGREFFWIESHTVQKNHEDVMKQVKEDMKITEKILLEELGIPFLLVERPEWDKFPGAESSYAYDILFPDGKILQIATTHNLGQRFSKPFDIKFENEKGEKQYAYQTCFGPGVSRMVAALISIHGDDQGLILPPNIAPIQAVIVPILKKGEEKIILDKAQEFYELLKKHGIRVELDDSQNSPGFKFNYWELRGVPLRIEIGMEELKQKTAVIYRRDTKEKTSVAEKDVIEKLKEIGISISLNLRKRAEQKFKANVKEAKNMKELIDLMKEGGFVKIPFCSVKTGGKCAEEVQEKTGAEIRGRLFAIHEEPEGQCIVCGKKANDVVYAGKAY